MNQFYLINSPLEQFEVINLISIQAPLLDYFNLTLTNLGLYCIIVVTLNILLFYSGINNQKLIPSQFTILLESFYASVLGLVRDQIGTSNERYLPFIFTLFFFIIIANLTGNIPYNFTVFTSVICAMGLSVTIFIGVTILALAKHQFKFFSYFIPSGTPLALVPLLALIELVSYLARAFSLGIRLFANMCAGHTLMNILGTFLGKMFTSSILMFFLTLIPFALFLGIMGLEIAVSVIQAYVFCILTCSYIKDAIYLH